MAALQTIKFSMLINVFLKIQVIFVIGQQEVYFNPCDIAQSWIRFFKDVI